MWVVDHLPGWRIPGGGKGGGESSVRSFLNQRGILVKYVKYVRNMCDLPPPSPSYFRRTWIVDDDAYGACSVPQQKGGVLVENACFWYVGLTLVPSLFFKSISDKHTIAPPGGYKCWARPHRRRCVWASHYIKVQPTITTHSRNSGGYMSAGAEQNKVRSVFQFSSSTWLCRCNMVADLVRMIL